MTDRLIDPPMQALELADDLALLSERWRDTELEPWRLQLPSQFESGLSVSRYGDIPRWRKALADLPNVAAREVALNQPVVGCTGEIAPDTKNQLETALRGLHPWRKGPYDLFGLYLDTEWRSDWKWDRLLPGLEPLEGRRVLDVGCGSGYHCWRMLGAGAADVIGIDPTPLFVMQFQAIQHFLRQPNIHVLPAAMEQLPRPLHAFDTVFSMGVLYHRRSPFDHLLELRDALRNGGQLVLETLVVDGGANTAFVPGGRYARMGNVWFLPSPGALCHWLEKLGFRNPAIIDVTQTTVEEQRSTEWMTFHSLARFLDPDDSSKSIEGHPAPTRAVITANAP